MDHKTEAPARRMTGRRWLAVAVAAVVVGVAAAGASVAGEGGMLHGRGCHHRNGAMDPVAMEKHIDATVERILRNGSAEQKTKVKAIAKAALADLHPLHTQFHDGHAQMAKLLTAPTIDRAALEQARVDEIKLADTASKRILLAVEDAADVLTPEQRAKLAEHLKSHMH